MGREKKEEVKEARSTERVEVREDAQVDISEIRPESSDKTGDETKIEEVLA